MIHFVPDTRLELFHERISGLSRPSSILEKSEVPVFHRRVFFAWGLGTTERRKEERNV